MEAGIPAQVQGVLGSQLARLTRRQVPASFPLSQPKEIHDWVQTRQRPWSINRTTDEHCCWLQCLEPQFIMRLHLGKCADPTPLLRAM